MLEELGNAEKVRIGGLVQLTVRVKPAQKARRVESGNGRGDYDRRQAGERRRARAATGEGEGSAAIGAKGASSAGCLTTPAVPPASPRRVRQGPRRL